MVRLVIVYGAIHMNVVLMSLFVMGYLEVGWLSVLQVSFLVLVGRDWIGYGKGFRSISWKKRAAWVGMGLLGMIGVSLLLSCLFSMTSENQAILLQVQRQVPLLSFLLFLINASIVEEYCYRELVWKRMKYPLAQLVVTSLLFALAHHPSGLATWLSYGSLGLILGIVRLKADTLSSILLHVSWNGLVFGLALL